MTDVNRPEPKAWHWAFLAALAIAQVWAFVLVIGVIANAGWVRSRAAGGAYDTFPVGLRVAYLLNVALVVGTAVFAWRLFRRGGARTKGQVLAARIVAVIFLLSTVVNAASRSVDERWNAIGAFVVAAYFFYWSRPRTK